MKPFSRNSDLVLAQKLEQEVNLGASALKDGKPDMAAMLFKSALQKAGLGFPYYDHITHNLLLSYKQQIEIKLRQQNIIDAKELLKRALQLSVRGSMKDNREFLRAFADAFQSLGQICFENLQFEASTECTRKAISIFPCPTYHVNLTNALAVSKKKPFLSDYTTRIKPNQLGQHIFIACVPKSASTFLKNVLVDLTIYKDLFAVYASGQNEHELYLPTLAEYAEFNSVTQQHCRASEANIQLMQAFNIKPVILVRNIFDSVFSLFDFYNQGAAFNSYHREDFLSLDDEMKLDLLIDNVIPWYFQFIASWSLVEKEKRLELFWLSYEEIVEDKIKAVEKVLNFYGLGASATKIQQIITISEADSRKTRFNKGVAGRGQVGLSDEQKDRIRNYSRYYPNTDFSRIGL